MNYENVKLWFAKDETGNIITIDDISENNKVNTYSCPMCGSNLIPKATKSIKITSHFAHVDASKCNSESMIHWWFKHRFLEKGDIFTVVSDRERQYICKEVLVEQSYTAADKEYRPDVTVKTECGSTIYFEMDYSNKKQIEDYLDIWFELKNIVVEVDVKKLIGKARIPTFKALFYDGKCFNVKKNDLYYNVIGTYKEEKFRSNQIDEETKDKIRKLDWFWNDMIRFKKNEVDIEYMAYLIDCFDGKERYMIQKILYKPSCIDLLIKYLNYKTDRIYSLVIISLGEEKEKYLQYIDKRVNKNTKKGFVEVRSLSDRTWKYYNINKYSLDEIINDTREEMNKNDFFIRNKEIVDAYNDEVKEVKNKIISNNSYSELLKYLDNLNREYTINLYMSQIHDEYKLIDVERLDTFEIKIILKCGLQICREFTYIIKNSNSEIDNLILEVKKRLNSHMKKKRLIKNLYAMDELSIELENWYSKLGLYIGGYIDKEDRYCINLWMTVDRIDIDENIYLWIDGLGYTFKDRKKIDTTSNISMLKTEIMELIDERIKSETGFRCISCSESFAMEVGELKFYIEKELDLPKRCKKCRASQKKYKSKGGL